MNLMNQSNKLIEMKLIEIGIHFNKLIEMELIEIELIEIGIHFNKPYWFISIKLLEHKPIRKSRCYWFAL